MKSEVIWDFPGGPVVKITPTTWIQYLTREDSTCLRATKPEQLSPSIRATRLTLEPASHNYWACAESLWREATAMKSLHTTTKSSPHSLQLEKAHVQQGRPSTAKNK